MTLLAAAGLAGILLLVYATFATVIRIKVGTTSDVIGHQTTFTGFDRHSIGLLLIAAIALPMCLGSRRGSRPAMVLLALCALAALIVAIAIDLPDLSATGEVGRDYANATAGPGAGYYAETLGGVLLLAAAGGMLLLTGRRAPDS